MKTNWSPAHLCKPVVTGLVLLLAVAGSSFCLKAAQADAYSLDTDLPRVGTYARLLQLLEKSQAQGDLYARDVMTITKSAQEAAPTSNDAAGAPGNQDHSSTNLQVAGVDEADLVKTDGQFIYQVNGQRVLVIRALPAEQMEVVAELPFTAAGFTPQEIYVDETHLVVIGSASRSVYLPGPSERMVPGTAGMIYPPVGTETTSQALCFDITDKTNIKKVRELDLDGSYLSSRKVGSSLYLLTNKYLDYYYIQSQTGLLPQYRDSIRGDAYVAEPPENIRYFPDCVSPNYLLTAALDLDQPARAAEIHCYLGSGDQVYASVQNLYVAVQRTVYPVMGLATPGIIYRPEDTHTRIYRFALQPGHITYSGAGQVPGRILNQFSMDEYDGFFRLATTSGEIWRLDQYTSANNVYILDDNLQITGRLENIAPGEKIYSTRFMGGRAYMVTFKQVDPFFVLDVKDPKNPSVLGKLKIPGYSDYLHPYDENHIIGFGKETVETKAWGGQSVAFYQGLKIALFDVTDVANPVEMSRTLIGDRGTDSEVLRNHKALLFSAAKKLLALPVTVMEVRPGDGSHPESPVPQYGSFAFQGLYVYGLDLATGLQYRGRITHITPQEYLKAGDNWYGSGQNIVRALYIGDTLYTLSDAEVRANRLQDLAQVGRLGLPPGKVSEPPTVQPLVELMR